MIILTELNNALIQRNNCNKMNHNNPVVVQMQMDFRILKAHHTLYFLKLQNAFL